LVLATLLGVRLPAQGPDDRYQRFSAAYASLDAERVSQVYGEDALYLDPGGGDVIRGRAKIRERFRSAMDAVREHGHKHTITFEFIDRTDAPNVRADVGYYTITTTTPEGHAESFRGKFSKVWRRDPDGVWRIHSDSYSPAPSK
jgi:uncharacterized protein (TIGR02246 family)